MTKSNGQVVMITGGAGNLGTATAKAFFAQGARLVLIDRAPDRLKRLYPELAGSRDHYLAPSVDILNVEAVDRTVVETLDRLGRIDVLVNTAGGFRAGPSLDQTPLDDWDALFDLNAKSVFLTCRAVIPSMRRQQFGRIVNISSRGGLKGDAGMALYSASKAAVIRLTESMASELKDAGINVNCVLPSIIDTEPNRQAMPSADFTRWVKPESVARVIVFLASDVAADVNGAAIPVYGRS
jgi:NAD(P)-dependent dehydrogenase (short-subunit alcohol dehydrogenase family)